MKHFKRTECEYGNYVDAQGVRYTVEWCSCIYSPNYTTPEQLGYEPYETQEEALAAWGLVPYIDPEAEQMMQDELLTNGNTND